MDALDTHVCGELPIEYHALKVAQEVLKVAARRDAAFEIPKPLRKEEYLARGGPKAVVAQAPREARGAIEASLYHEYLQSEWRPELLHAAYVTVMNRHTHEHGPRCAYAGKDGKGKGNYQCAMCAPWVHDVEHTRCIELRAFEGQAPEHESEDESVVRIQFYQQANPSHASDADELQRRGRLPVGSQLDVPVDCDRAHLRELLSYQLNRAMGPCLFHVYGGGEVVTTLRKALAEGEGEVVKLIYSEPIEFRCSHCHPLCLLGKQVDAATRKIERDKEDNIRDLYYHAYAPSQPAADGADRRSLVVDVRRRLLPTKDELRRFDTKVATCNELAELVKRVREGECFSWQDVGVDELRKTMDKLLGPGQILHELLQRAEFRALRERIEVARAAGLRPWKAASWCVRLAAVESILIPHLLEQQLTVHCKIRRSNGRHRRAFSSDLIRPGLVLQRDHTGGIASRLVPVQAAS